MIRPKNIFREPDKTLAIVGIFAGIILVFILAKVGRSYIDVMIVTIMACLLYLLLRQKFPAFKQISFPRFQISLYLLLNIAFFALIIYSLLLLYFISYVRPLSYFIAVALMAALLAIEILIVPEEKKYSGFIFFKIIVMAIILRWSLYYIYPSSYLGTDPWSNPKLGIINAQSGHLSGTGYFYMPTSLLYPYIASKLLSITDKTALIISTGFIEIISLIYVFLLGRDMFSARIGLLSALVLGINNLHIEFGWWIVAMTLGVSFTTAILYLLLSAKGNVFNIKIIILLLLITLIVTHHLTSFVTLILLSGLYLGYRIYILLYKDKTSAERISGYLVLIFGIAVISYWIYNGNFFAGFVQTYSLGTGKAEFYGAYVALGAGGNAATRTSPFWLEVNKIGVLIIYFLASIGILFILNRRNVTTFRFSLIFGVIIVTAVTFTNFIFHIGGLYIGRWFLFIQVLLAIPVTIGLMLICNLIKTNWVKLLSAGGIIFCIAFFMVINTEASIDSPTHNILQTVRWAFTDSEIQAAHSLSTDFPGTIKIDWAYLSPMAYGEGKQIELLSVKTVQEKFAGIRGLIAVRNYWITDFMPINEGAISYKFEFNYDPYQELSEQRFDSVYQSGTVTAYYR